MKESCGGCRWGLFLHGGSQIQHCSCVTTVRSEDCGRESCLVDCWVMGDGAALVPQEDKHRHQGLEFLGGAQGLKREKPIEDVDGPE